MKKIEINDMLKYKFLSNLNFSDDGKTLVFLRTVPPLPRFQCYGKQIIFHIMNLIYFK